MDTRAEHSATPPSLRELVDRYAPDANAPLPGAGHTFERWRLLARVGHAHGAVAIKLFESHLDALAILAELAAARPAVTTRWAVWAAEPPFATVEAQRSDDTHDALRRDAGLAAAPTVAVRLTGRKAWCSGAREITHALMTCRDWHGARRLAIVAIAPHDSEPHDSEPHDIEPHYAAANGDAVPRGSSSVPERRNGEVTAEPAVEPTDDGWKAVGMARTHSGDVLFRDAPALLLGDADAYLNRPGFWQGGAGIAACWYGAVLPFADALRASLNRRADPHAAAHLGGIDGQLRAAAALLRESAAWIDLHPTDDAMAHALRVRTVVEAAVQHTMQHAGNALGAGPLCRDARLAALYADLPVFVRQSHAERDLATLGAQLAADDTTEWSL